MSWWGYAALGVVVGTLLIFWLYIAARVITRAVMRTNREGREQNHGKKEK